MYNEIFNKWWLSIIEFDKPAYIFYQYVSLATPVFAETTFITTYNDRDVTKFSHISFKPTVCTKDQSII